MNLLSNEALNKLSNSQKKEYFNNLKKECLSLKDIQLHIGQNIIKNVYPYLRNYKFEFIGTENIPKDSNALFIVNHSNSHDIFTAYEVLSALNRQGSVMVASDCLTPITTEIFNISDATLLDRRKSNEREQSIFKMSHKILEGKDGVIFGESTWNLHPTLLMHNIKKGGAIISSITQVPIIPTIFEYIEKDDLVDKESNLYKKCVVYFGKPVMIDPTDCLISQTNSIKNDMSNLRQKIWDDNNVIRNKIDDIDPMIYLNHTYTKKFKAFGFTYDSLKEQNNLLYLGNEPRENEYTLDKDGNFVPGITEKNSGLKKILYK